MKNNFFIRTATIKINFIVRQIVKLSALLWRKYVLKSEQFRLLGFFL
ncbi:hypothetical protein [Leptotrichia sp. oral taxon 847]|nr:hypothetical protein [Leptotrichia sp. oral taxon 847]